MTVELIDTTQSFDVYINSILVKEGLGIKEQVKTEEGTKDTRKSPPGLTKSGNF